MQCSGRDPRPGPGKQCLGRETKPGPSKQRLGRDPNAHETEHCQNTDKTRPATSGAFIVDSHPLPHLSSFLALAALGLPASLPGLKSAQAGAATSRPDTMPV